MARLTKYTAFLAPALALVALGGCAESFNANVARFQQLPAPQGQSFTVVADDPRLAGSLEFAQYASLVAAKLGQVGYVATNDPARADLIVRMNYMVDGGKEKIRSTGFAPDPFWRSYGFYPGFYGRGYYRGFYDPFLFGGGYDNIESYTVYTSRLQLRIDGGRGQRVFEGTATAQSLSDKLTYLVPNLIDAMFTNFPGKSGEDIQITLPPEKR
ncbi:MAG: DUF4136 domain-containing protein [Sphingobium sp.]